MKKIKVSYTPTIVYIISAIIWVAVMFVISGYLNELGFYICVLAGLAALLFVYCQGTVVEYGEGKIIRCRSFFYKWKIDLERIDTFSYTVRKYHARGGIRHMMVIMFDHSMRGINDCYKLTSFIGENEMKKLMYNEADKLDIMQIYKFAESLYPDKARGYTEKEDINA
ncbi:hypothetical protein [Ruminococcus sp.]